MTWTLEFRPNEPILPLLQVIILQDAWSRLTKKSRAALVAVAEDPNVTLHPLTVRSLQAHGLLDEHGITQAGAAVLRFRPDQTKEEHGV
jgi:hypothetical protein